MIIDSSVILSILLAEPDAVIYAPVIDRAPTRLVSVASYLEVSMYLERNVDEIGRAMLDSFLDEFDITLEPVTVSQIHLARQAFRLFGKGLHPAALNFGDCFTYALARERREPLLFKGNGFSRTDLLSALPSS